MGHIRAPSSPCLRAWEAAIGLSHGAFSPPRGIEENLQKWPLTCVLSFIGPHPTVSRQPLLLSCCPEEVEGRHGWHTQPQVFSMKRRASGHLAQWISHFT